MAGQLYSSYTASLGDTIVFCDNSYNIVKSLKGKVKQCAVSNGTVVAQTKKLRLSGLGELFDGVYSSEDLGVEKPNEEFFNKVFDDIGPINKDEVLIVRDSLTSDICGGNNADISTCWYNPSKTVSNGNYKIDYEITDLHQIYDILNL